MMSMRFLLIFLLSGYTFWVTAQTAVGDYKSGFQRQGNVFTFSNTNAEVKLEFCTPSMLRIRSSWDQNFEDNEPWMVVQYDWPTLEIQATEAEDHFLLETEKLSVRVNKAPFTIDIATSDGQLLSSETLADHTGGGFQQEEGVLCRKQLMPDEHFFGFGERMDFMDQRGKTVSLNVGRGEGRPHIIGAYNILEANYCPVPFFMSTRGYGIFLHNAYATEWDMGKSSADAYTFKAEGGELDYYFLYGPDFPAILDQYTDLTGKSPLLPLFALGLQVGTYSGGTWGYEELTSTQYVIALARKFRELGIPVDVLHLDSTWRIFGDTGGKGATTFEWRPTFDNPEAMFDSLYAMHYNMIGLHIRPRFDNGNTLNLLAQAQQKGYVYPEENNPGEFVNFFDTAAVNWWWENGAMKVASIGARFFKTDEGSAFGRKANESDKVGPTGEKIRRLHNLFPLAYAKAPYEKFAKYNATRGVSTQGISMRGVSTRGMNHTREGYAGIQRYPFIFAGDWPSEWQYFAPVIKAGLNIGLSGVGYWAHCMGGFEHKADPELYIRWCQFGLLSPIAHLFGMDHPGYKEPWHYGEEAQRIFKKYDQLRYRLLPYLYSHAYEMYQTGMPLMRALVLAYQDDPNTYDIADQYLLGSHMMICPVTTKGAQTRVVYLPEGTWINYWTGQPYEGKQYLNVVTPLDTMPIFIKGGAIIPMRPVVNYISEPTADTITLAIYPKGTSSFTLYDDDGKSLAYQQDTFAITQIVCRENKGQVQVDIQAPKGKYKLPERSYQLQIHRDTAPAAVNIAGKNLQKVTSQRILERASTGQGWYYDQDQQLLYVSLGSSRQGLQVNIQ